MTDNAELGNNLEENKEVSEKTFTQDEVNEIIKKRLAREKSGADEAINAREAELNRRELQLQLRERMAENSLPKELATIIKADSEEDINNALSLLNKYIKASAEENKGKNVGSFRIGVTSQSREEMRAENPFRKVMGLN